MRELEDILVDYFAGDELSPEESRVLVEWLEQGNHREIITALQGGDQEEFASGSGFGDVFYTV